MYTSSGGSPEARSTILKMVLFDKFGNSISEADKWFKFGVGGPPGYCSAETPEDCAIFRI